jgi:hypothetical protein
MYSVQRRSAESFNDSLDNKSSRDLHCGVRMTYHVTVRPNHYFNKSLRSGRLQNYNELVYFVLQLSLSMANRLRKVNLPCQYVDVCTNLWTNVRVSADHAYNYWWGYSPIYPCLPRRYAGGQHH